MSRRMGTLKVWVGFAAGVAVVALLLPGWTVRGGTSSPGAHITLAPQRSVNLDVHPVARPLARKELVPSAAARGLSGVVSARNATADTLRVRLRANPESWALDNLLQIRVHRRGHTVFSGPLGALRDGVSLGTLASHATMSLRVRAWLAPEAGSGWAGRWDAIPLTFETTARGES